MVFGILSTDLSTVCRVIFRNCTKCDGMVLWALMYGKKNAFVAMRNFNLVATNDDFCFHKHWKQFSVIHIRNRISPIITLR